MTSPFTDAELERMRAFREVAQRVRDSSIIDEGRIVRLTVLRREGGKPIPDDTSEMLPREAFDSLVMQVRLAYMDGEPAHFFSVSGLLGKGATQEQRKRIKQLRMAWRRTIEGPHGLVYSLHGKRYTDAEVFKLWLYGFAFHLNPEMRKEYREIEQAGGFVRFGVETTALKLAGRILDLDDIIADILGEEPVARIRPRKAEG